MKKRVKSADLPFFSNLMSSLNKAKFKCPTPILNKKSTYHELQGQEFNDCFFSRGKSKKFISR